MNQWGSACTTKHTQHYPADETETQLQGIVNVGGLCGPLPGVRVYGCDIPQRHPAEYHKDAGVGSLIMACPGLLHCWPPKEKNSILVIVMVAAAGLSCTASLFISAYSCLTLTYGEEDQEVFHHHNSREVTFVLHRMVKGANATILLSCIVSLALSCLIMYMGCRSLPHRFCYNNRIGLEMLVPQSEPRDTELVSTWQGGDNRLF
ncbi:uncharacterized protein [Takifugu rubripes]|uniref:uncharacterized protein n=1 Tax=Takifugu rubripes TaxID=31033 RepID=UPI001145EB2E|nr:uncharacterized protein LOC115252450 [Takifugu rubripes]